MARPYRFLEHTGDAFLEASGASLAEAMAGAAQALFAVMVDLRGVKVRQWADVHVVSTGASSLLVDWLNELIYQWETTGLLLRRFVVERATETEITARCGGEPSDPQRHRLKAQVKAATYHQAQVARRGGRWTVRVILDL